MSRSMHTVRTVGKRPNGDRTRTRRALRAGRWDDVDTFAPTHTFRTGVEVQ